MFGTPSQIHSGIVKEMTYNQKSTIFTEYEQNIFAFTLIQDFYLILAKNVFI